MLILQVIPLSYQPRRLGFLRYPRCGHDTPSATPNSLFQLPIVSPLFPFLIPILHYDVQLPTMADFRADNYQNFLEDSTAPKDSPIKLAMPPRFRLDYGMETL